MFETFKKAFQEGFEKTSGKKLSKIEDFEKRFKKLEEGELSFFKESEITIIQCSEYWADWLVCGFPFDAIITSKAVISGEKGFYLKRVNYERN